jgi:NTP pyrophosphatase (non-canonical NTP hydrolase)
MTFDDYQQAALKTASDAKKKNELFHLVLGLVGESGEIAEKMKKWVRDQNSDESKLDVDDLAKELGDVLWYTAVLANYLGLSFEDIATKNIAKLADRHQRGVLKGSGDNR